MKSRCYVLPIVILTIVFLACNRSNRSIFTLNRAEELMQAYPDSALRLLDSLSFSRIGGQVNRARYALLYSQALDKNYIDTDNDSLISIAVHYYRDHGTAREKALAQYYYGRVLTNAEAYEKAALSYLQAEELSLKCDDDLLLGLTYCQLGNLYYNQNLFGQALDYYLKSAEAHRRSHSRKHLINCYQAIIATLILLKQHDKARQYYDEITSSASPDDSASIHMLNKAIIISYIQHNDLRKAQEYLDRIPRNGTYDLLWGQYYLASNDLTKAIRAFSQSLHSDTTSSYEHLQSLYGLYFAHKSLKNYEQAIAYHEQYFHYVDSLFTLNEAKNILAAEKKYDNEKLSFDNYKLSTRQNYLMILLLIIVSVLYLSIHRYRQFRKVKNRQIEESLNEISILLESKNELLNQLNSKDEKVGRLKALLSNRYDALQKFAELAYQYSTIPNVLQKHYNQLLKMTSDNNALYRDLRNIIDETYDRATERLRKKFPSLTEKDIDTICLILAGFTNPALCVLFGYKDKNNIYVYKHRLKIKLGLAPTEEIDDFVRNRLN